MRAGLGLSLTQVRHSGDLDMLGADRAILLVAGPLCLRQITPD